VPVKDLLHKLQQMLDEIKRKDKSWPKMDSIIRRMKRNQRYAQQGF
jgi:hypothetical protein